MAEQHEYFLYFNSDIPSSNPQENRADHFFADLNRDVNLQGRWEMALLETNRKNVDIQCNWCKFATFPQNSQMLRQVGGMIPFPYYVPVMEGCRRNIEFKLNKDKKAATLLAIHLRKI